MTTSEPPKGTPSDDVMKDALDRFEESQDGSEENREAYYEDIKFARAADQWPDAIKKQRIQEARPVLVINKLPPLIRAVVNESRQNKPAIKVAPVDNGADEDTAEVIGGIIRSVERVSNASVAYDTAIDHAVTAGFGFFRISIDYAHDESFDLEAIIDRIPNALMVHWDVTSTKFDASDWEYAFISEKVGERDFERRYPDASKVPFDGDTRNDGSDNWISDDDIRLAEYFLRVSVQRKLLQLQIPSQEGAQPDIVAVREDDVPMMAQRFLAAGGIDANPEDPHLTKEFFRIASIQVLQERDVEAHKVERRIMNGQEVLEEDEWPGSMIPICPVWGDEIYIDGRRTFRSMIRDAKDPQVMLNFWRSATTELVALAPKAPWVGPKGFIPKGDESKWRSANTRSHAYLEYDPAAGAPARQEFAGVPSGALNEGMMANDDMKAITGIYDPSLGAEANEKSGVAIRARQNQGDISNFHFIDNLSRAIGYCGNCLLEIIPAIYSARQTVRILGEDQAENVVKLTQQAGGAKQKQADGDEALYNLTVGKYDVSVSQGPSFASQREETRETLIEIMRQVPDAAAFLGDVLLDHMDFVGADKVAKRLKGLLPPEVRQAEEDADSGKDPEVSRLQQQLKAQGQEHEQIKGQVMQEIEKLQAELEKEKANNQAAMAKAQSDADLKGRELELKGRELVIKENEAVTAAQKVELTPEQEEAIRQDEQTFQAEENAKDRRVDLAKSIIAKIEDDDDVEVQSAVARKAMGQADDILTATRPAPGD